MQRGTAVEIEKLCDDWCSASVSPEGGMAIGPSTEKFRLLANGIQFHELSHESLCSALIGLSKVLLRPGLSTIIDLDHFALWSWCGELLFGPRSNIFPDTQHEINSLYQTCIHAALTHCRKPPTTPEERQEQHRIHEMQPHHAKQLLRESSLVLAYLSFPLLEAVLKRTCSNFVSLDGQVVSAFSVPNRQGTQRQYDPNGLLRNRKCSSLRDLLFLHSNIVAGPRLKSLIDRFRLHLTSLDASLDPFDLIYAWRNQSLHGSTNFQTIGGTVLNFTFLITIFEIEHSFEALRSQTLEHCRREAMSRNKSPWSFYPPY